MSETNSTDPTCWYVAYRAEQGASYRIFISDLDMDNAHDLQVWIEGEEGKRGCGIVPTFWKRLSSTNAESNGKPVDSDGSEN